MLAASRAFAKSWVAAVLMGLLIISFAVFSPSVRDVFNFTAPDTVIRAGSRTITSADFKREFDSVRSNLEQQYSQQISPELAVQNGLDKQLLTRLAARESFAELVRKIGVRPSDKLIADQIQKIPAFFDQVSGRFDKKQYQQRLGENGLTPDKFEAAMRDDISEQHLATAIANGVIVPRAYSAMAAVYMLESRDVSFFVLPPTAAPAPGQPTDAQLTAFMRENSDRLMQPEFRVLSVVRFTPDPNAPVTLTEADLRKRYDFRKDTLSTPERRTLVQIPAKDPATAQQIVARLGRGEAPAAVAKAVGVDAINYADKPQSAVPDRKIAAAAFQMPPGQATPVQGDIGLAVVKVLGVTPGRVVTFEEARPQLEAELRKDAAAEKAYQLSQAYDTAHQGGANLVESAAKAGVAVQTIGPVSKDGRGATGQPVMGFTPKLAETAFALPAGGESEVTDGGNGDYFAVRVERVMPPALPPLDQIRPQLAQAWTMQQMGRSLQAKAAALAERVRKGESLEAVAASVGGRVDRAAGVSRQNAQQNQQAPQPVVGQAFSAKPGEVFVSQIASIGFAVAKLDAVRAGDTAQLAQGVELARQQMSSTIVQEMVESAQQYARGKIKPKVDTNRARTALGLEPLPAPGKAEKAK